MTSLKSRVLVMIVGVPLLAWVVLWAPALVLRFTVGALALIAAYELLKCVGVETRGFLPVWTMICAFAAAVLPGEYAPVCWILYVMLAFLCAIVKAGELKFLHLAAGICAVAVIPYAFSAFLRIEAMGLHRAYLLLPFILSFACDTFAYIVGCSIGKHKLAPKVSPKKSVEGSVGGFAGNVLCGLVFAFVMDRWFGGSIGYGAMIVLALVCGAVAQIGDLSFSLIKREFGIKDYGKLFLAHGGVLDRFDSVLFVAPVIELILNFVR